MNRVIKTLFARTTKDKPAPEPGEFKIEEKWKSQLSNYYNYFADKKVKSTEVCRRLNAYEAMKVAIRDYLSGPTLGKSTETLRERMAIIDDYEAGNAKF